MYNDIKLFIEIIII